MSGKTPTGGRTTVGKKIPLVTVAAPEEAARLAGLPLEATVAMADVAGAIRDGLMAFASATGLVVMYDLMVAELTERIGPKHARTTAYFNRSRDNLPSPASRSGVLLACPRSAAPQAIVSIAKSRRSARCLLLADSYPPI
jgi:hypothetical protein